MFLQKYNNFIRLVPKSGDGWEMDCYLNYVIRHSFHTLQCPQSYESRSSKQVRKFLSAGFTERTMPANFLSHEEFMTRCIARVFGLCANMRGLVRRQNL